MLGQHVERAGTEAIGIALARLDRVECGARLEIFEAIARHDQRPARLVEPVVSATDTLEQPRRTLGRPHLDHAVDIAPVETQIEAGGCDERPQSPLGHGVFGALARLAVEAAVMDRDRQRQIVDLPQFLENQLGQPARVAEDDRRAVLRDFGHHLMHRIASRMPRPRHRAFGQQDRNVGIGAALALDQRHARRIALGREPGAIGVRIGNRRRQADAPQPRRNAFEAREREAEQIAALAGREGVDFVDDHRLQIGEHREAVGIGQQQRQRFGGGQQDIGRPTALARLFVRTGIAAPAFDADVEVHVGDRAEQVALDIGGQRLERRDIEGVQPVGRVGRKVDQTGEKAGQCLAGAGRRHAFGQHRLDCRCGAHRHEGGGADLAARGRDHAGARLAVHRVQRERKPFRHRLSPGLSRIL